MIYRIGDRIKVIDWNNIFTGRLGTVMDMSATPAGVGVSLDDNVMALVWFKPDQIEQIKPETISRDPRTFNGGIN